MNYILLFFNSLYNIMNGPNSIYFLSFPFGQAVLSNDKKGHAAARRHRKQNAPKITIQWDPDQYAICVSGVCACTRARARA